MVKSQETDYAGWMEKTRTEIKIRVEYKAGSVSQFRENRLAIYHNCLREAFNSNLAFT